MRISVSGLVRDGSGIGILQRKLYPELERLGVELEPLPSRDRGSRPRDRVSGMAAGALSVPQGQAYLSTVSPLPIRVSVPIVAYVYDVRWRHTRGRAARIYRQADFRRTMRCADRILTLSEAIATEIADLAPSSAHKIRVIHCGPGQVAGVCFAPKISGKVVLIGSDAHKQNERAIRALLNAQPPWLTEVVGINVSEAARASVSGHDLESVFSFRSHLDEGEFLAELGSADFYLNLGTNEGFGLPYIEALSLGCQVIVMDQPLTREILGQSGILLRPGPDDVIAAQLAHIAKVDEPVRRMVAESYSWSAAASKIISILAEVQA